MSASLQLTPQQQAILGSEKCSVAVSAGAGCGKTFVLTQRFIGYLRGSIGRPDPLGSIVAITFTDRAAREMRHRVRITCESELKSCNVDQASYWLDVLRGLDGARISTIHSFCSNLLRRFAVEAGLDPTFGQLDVSFGNTFVRRAIREALCRLLENENADAGQLVVKLGFEKTESLLRDLIDGMQTIDSAVFDSMTPQDLASCWQQSWTSECLPRLLQEFRDCDSVRTAVELLQAHEPSHAVMRERRALLLQALAGDSNISCEMLTTLNEAARVSGGGGKSAWTDEAVYEEVKDCLEAVRKSIGGFAEDLRIAEADPLPAAEIALAAHRVARTVAEEYTRRKWSEAQLDFDDLLCLARNLLRDNESVRRRAMRGIELLMVDEFQDTDPVQADLVRLLCGDRLCDGRLFLVGDAKQSIYRFRRADPRVFAALRNELPAKGRLPLTTNFRSQPAILRFVNETFANEMAEYEPLEPIDPKQYSPEPSVEFLFSLSEDKSDNAELRRRREARWIARRIKSLLEDETPRIRDQGTLRRVRPGDIAILFRALSNVHLYEQALVEEGLEYYLAGGRAFFAQQEVHDLANLCRWLEDPADELSLAGVLRSPFFGLSDDTLLLLKPEPTSRFINGLHKPPKLPETQAEQVRRAAATLDELRARKDFLGIADLLQLAVDRTGYDAALLCEHLGSRKLANLRKLIAQARALDEAGGVTLGEFVIRLNEAIREQDKEELAATHPEVADVLRLMTIHQSKGLEFPVVVVADLDGSRRGGENTACYDRVLGPIFSLPDDGDGKPPHLGQLLYRKEQNSEDEAEQVRLFYVAVTRAKDHLILSACLQHDAKPRSPWTQLLARRFDLLTGLPVLDAYFGSAGGSLKTPPELSQIRVHREEPSVAAAATKPSRERSTLSKFREFVSTAEPVPLPPISHRLEPDVSMRSEFTVSQICRADQELRGESPESLLPDEEELGEQLAESTLDALINSGVEDAARRVGILTHAALELLDFRQPSKAAVQEVVERAAASIGELSEKSLVRAAAKKVEALIGSPIAAELAKATRLEREIGFRRRWKTRSGNVEIIGTIDGWYEDERGWHVVDFKAVESAFDAATLRQYQLQVLMYALALQPLLGGAPASLKIARLGATVETHAVAVDPRALDEASQRIDAAIEWLRSPDRVKVER